MKTLTKKILTVCLTLAMACALAIPAFADFDNGYNGYHIRNESIGGNNYLNMEGTGGSAFVAAKIGQGKQEEANRNFSALTLTKIGRASCRERV